MKYCLSIATTLTILTLALPPVDAGRVDIHWTVSTPGPEAVADGAPDGGMVLDMFATTSADILSIGSVEIIEYCPLFNVDPPFGSNTSPPDPLFVSLWPALEADSWITTPGRTSLLGADLPGDGSSTFGDLEDNGPQDMFHFARLTFQGPHGLVYFAGRVTIAGSSGPESFGFVVPNLGIDLLPCIVPEPQSIALFLAGAISLAAARHRIEAV